MNSEQETRCTDICAHHPGRWRKVTSKKYPGNWAVTCKVCGSFIGFIPKKGFPYDERTDSLRTSGGRKKSRTNP